MDHPVEHASDFRAGGLRPLRVGLEAAARVVGALAEALITVALLGELGVLFGNVMLRWITGHSLLWSSEIATLCLEILAFVGGAVAYRRRQHLSLRLVSRRLSLRGQATLESVMDALVLALSVGVVLLSIPLLDTGATSKTPILQISGTWYTAPLVVGMALMALFAFERLASRSLRISTLAAAAAGALVLAIMLLHSTGADLTPLATWLAVLAFVAVLALGLPIGFTLLGVSLFYLYTSGVAPPSGVPITMQGSIDNFILLAVPFFILAGFIMTAGGLNEPLADFVESLVGHIRGGLLQVIVVTMYIFSGISGSKTADVAAVGTALKPSLDRQGYDSTESVSVISAAAVMGETVPPSIALLILASITSLSVSSLFLAGIIPAAVIGVCLMVGVYVLARKLHGIRDIERAGWSTRAKAFLRAIPALAVPLVLAGGILGGVATPTEVSSIAVVYGLVAAVVIYRSHDVRLFVRLLSTSASMAGMILFIYSVASGLGWTVTIAGLAQKFATWLESVSHSQAVFLLVSVAILIVMGALLEGVPALVILAPLMMPLTSQYGVNPLHYGIVMIIAMGLGSFIPPLGLGVYVAASIFHADLEAVTRRMVPYLLVVFVGLLVVVYVPWFTLVLPRAFGLR